MVKQTVKNYAMWGAGILLLTLIVYACRRDDFLSERMRQSTNRELTRSTAQQWFEQHNLPVVEFDFGANTVAEGSGEKISALDGAVMGSGQSGLLAKPNWADAKEKRKGDIEVVELTMMTKGRALFMDSETKALVSDGADSRSIRNTAKLVVHKDLRIGHTRSFLMVFVGTYAYLRNGGKISKNSYFNRDPDFEGDVLFYKLDGTLINGWRYRGGKIVS
uniref:hypothetical protein n=1 Tax=Parapedobacter tibetensis TaxID=2972951 RepID=UPI00214DD8CB